MADIESETGNRRSLNQLHAKLKGRGARSNPVGRFAVSRSVYDCGDEDRDPNTEVFAEQAKSIIARNTSPDVPFTQSINPYRGCEHGCVYCYARPSHAYMDLSPGLDFETKLFFKKDAARRLEEALAKPNYRCQPITIGANTDAYQPLEKKLRITRELLQVMQRFQQPCVIITKSGLVTRDIDILAQMAKRNLCSVMVSVTSLDSELKRYIEPRAASAAERLRAIRQLREAGIPVGVLMAPIIPFINDDEIEAVLAAVKEAGALTANYIFLRLPYEVRDLFFEWLRQRYPEKADHVISLIRQSRGGKDNVYAFGARMRGSGVFADMISQRFAVACKRLGLKRRETVTLNNHLFKPPGQMTQVDLF